MIHHHRMFILSSTLWLAATTGVHAADERKVTERWAVLIGVDDYAYAQKLKYCGADQEPLAEKLIKSGFDEDHVFLLHDKAENPRLRPSFHGSPEAGTPAQSLATALRACPAATAFRQVESGLESTVRSSTSRSGWFAAHCNSAIGCQSTSQAPVVGFDPTSTDCSKV